MGVKKNFGYNLILTFCNYLFPLITYPYVSRVLGVTKIGVCNFVDSVVNYFILFSTLGIVSYGIREIARCGDSKEHRDEVFTNLFLTNIILVVPALIVLYLCTYYVPQLQPYTAFWGVGAMKILFNVFLIEWFFQGIERFKYITISSVVIRFFYVIAVLLLVREEDDVLMYYFLTSFIVVVNAIVNWTYSKRFAKLSFKHLSLMRYLVPILIFGYYRILTSMYTTFNVTFLGFSSGNDEVGYFSTATKLYGMLLGVFTAFTTVMVPRVSNLLSQKDYPQLQKIADTTFEMLFILGIPLVVFCIFYAPEIIEIIAGKGYEGAILPFQIIIFLLLVVGMEQIVIQQFLMASTSNKSIIILSSVGAAVGISMNFLITPTYGAIGSSISWCLSEISVLITGVILMRKHVHITIKTSPLVKITLMGLAYIPVNYSMVFFLPSLLGMVATIVLSIAVFIILNLCLLKNQLLLSLIDNLRDLPQNFRKSRIGKK